MDYLAHKGQLLVDHLRDVGDEASRLASAFDAATEARFAGLLHDLGKAENEFQTRINTDDKQGKKETHAHHGAALAVAVQNWPVALAINGMLDPENWTTG